MRESHFSDGVAEKVWMAFSATCWSVTLFTSFPSRPPVTTMEVREFEFSLGPAPALDPLTETDFGFKNAMACPGCPFSWDRMSTYRSQSGNMKNSGFA